VGRPADPDLGAALMAQMRTDELRELLERYPHLDRRELRRLRELYRTATATEVIAIKSSATLARKAERLDDRDGSPGDVLLIAAAAATLGILLFLMTGLG